MQKTNVGNTAKVHSRGWCYRLGVGRQHCSLLVTDSLTTPTCKCLSLYLSQMIILIGHTAYNNVCHSGISWDSVVALAHWLSFRITVIQFRVNWVIGMFFKATLLMSLSTPSSVVGARWGLARERCKVQVAPSAHQSIWAIVSLSKVVCVVSRLWHSTTMYTWWNL